MQNANIKIAQLERLLADRDTEIKRLNNMLRSTDESRFENVFNSENAFSVELDSLGSTSNKAIYLTDDRDKPDDEQKTLVVFQGGNGDWYIQVAGKNGRSIEGVRLCTSGGASTRAPGLTKAAADMWRAITKAKASEIGDY